MPGAHAQTTRSVVSRPAITAQHSRGTTHPSAVGWWQPPKARMLLSNRPEPAARHRTHAATYAVPMAAMAAIGDVSSAAIRAAIRALRQLAEWLVRSRGHQHAARVRVGPPPCRPGRRAHALT